MTEKASHVGPRVGRKREMAVTRVQKEIGGQDLILETGRIANQAHGAVWVQYGETIVLVTVLSAPSDRQLDFFPLFVDYRENQYAAGKFPGGFFKREGRPTTKEILTMRMIDRPIRPLFPYDFRNEVQIQCMVLSFDGQNDPDILALIGASAALELSPAPFDGPIGVARVSQIDGKLVVNPTIEQMADAKMNLIAAGPDDINMIECDGLEVTEAVVAEATDLARGVMGDVISLIKELAASTTVEKTFESKGIPQELKDLIIDRFGDRMREAKQIPAKADRSAAFKAIRQELLDELCPADVEEPEYNVGQVKEAFYKSEGLIQRQLILSGTRPDGRGRDELRELGVDVGVLPRTHGSAIFSRGETQALVTATLGTPRDEQIIDGLREEHKKRFMLHYNFPPFSVGEIRPIRGPGRREIGHGALAEKSLEAVMPTVEQFPYTVRLVADIMESNGSTSQAAVCGATLALMDAGVPIKAPVAGISVGMVEEGDKYLLLTDIVGEEDFHGDMDFKVAGTTEGITGIQLDMKARGICQDRIVETLAQAQAARMKILEAMTNVIATPNTELSQHAPRMLTVKINPEKIGKVIGPGGKMINKIQDETGAKIDIEEDGTIFISSVGGGDGAEQAREMVAGIGAEVEVGKVYKGTVVSIRDFGAFIEILPGQDGLCHVSELDSKFVKDVEEVCKVGDEMEVKVINIDNQGRVKLSRKVLMQPEGGEGENA
jgi:polyribonucleotide nucleotidyltransferase